jgi:hypothetical protein
VPPDNPPCRLCQDTGIVSSPGEAYFCPRGCGTGARVSRPLAVIHATHTGISMEMNGLRPALDAIRAARRNGEA